MIRFDPIGGGLDFTALAGDRRRHEPVLGRPQQGQAIDRRRPAVAARAGDPDRADLRARSRDAGLLLTNFPLRALARVPTRSPPRRADLIVVSIVGKPRRLVGGRLYRESRDRLSLGDRPPMTPERPVQPSPAGVGRRSPAHSRRPGCWRRSATADGPARASSSASRSPTSRSRWSETSARSPRSRSTTAERPQVRQLPLWRVRPRLRDARRDAASCWSPSPMVSGRVSARATGLRDALAVLEQQMGLDFREEGDRFRARRGDRGDPRAVDHHPIARRGARGLRRPRRVLERLPAPSPSWSRSDPRLLVRQSDVRRRSSSPASAPTACPPLPSTSGACRVCRRAGRRCSASTPTRSSRTARAARRGDRPAARPGGGGRPRVNVASLRLKDARLAVRSAGRDKGANRQRWTRRCWRRSTCCG